MKPARREYRIGEVSMILGEPVHVIRFWEAQIGLVPARSRSNRRVYTERHVGYLRLLRFLVREEKFTLEGAKEQIRRLHH